MKVWFITDMKYPGNDAPCVRIHYLSRIIALCGHEVCVFGRGKEKKGEYLGTPFISLRGDSENKLGLLWHYSMKMSGQFLSAVSKGKPHIIITYNISTSLMKRLISNQKKYGYRLLNDCVEWYSKEESSPFSLDRVQYHRRNYWMRHILPQHTEVIAISKYLEHYFKDLGTKCTYLPSMCDIESMSAEKEISKDKIVIAYAGSPGRKDMFAPVILALLGLSESVRKNLLIRIIGSSREAIAKNAGVSAEQLNILEDCLEFLPRMSHDAVLEQLEKVDFTILIRPQNMRYAKAGFPTKVPESLATGTPVICNLTSDLGDFLVDEENALIAKDESVESVKDVLQRAIHLTLEQREHMCACARKTAEDCFDYRLYTKAMGDFLRR